MSILQVLIFGFSSAVALVWIKHHFFVLPDHWVSIALPFLTSIATVSPLLFFFGQLRKKYPSLSTNFSRPIFIPVMITGLGFIIFNTQAFLRGLLIADGPLIPLSSFLSTNLSFGLKLSSLLLLFFLLTIAFLSAGHFCLRVIARVSEEKGLTVYGTMLRLIVGIFAWSTYLLLIGMIDALHMGWIWIAFLLLIINERFILQTYTQLLFKKISWPDVNYMGTQVLLWCSLFLIAFTLTQSIRPIPTGYDDMTQYMNRANLIAENGMLIAGGYPYPFELLAAGIRIAAMSDHMMLAMGIGSYSLILTAFILFAFGRDITHSTRVGLMAATILLALPMSAALTIREVKPDTLLGALTLFVFWSLTKTVLEKNISAWYAALFVFCFAITVKLTAFFLVASIAITLFAFLHIRHEIAISPKRILAITIGAGLLALLPWLLYGFAHRPLDMPSSPQGFLLSDAETHSGSKLSSELSTYVWQESCLSTGASEDFARFDPGRDPVMNWLLFPWDLTMNLEARSFATEITLLFLGLLPLFLLRRKGTHFRDWYTQPMLLLSLFGVSYFFLWVILGERVAWYAFPGFALLALILYPPYALITP